MNAAIGERLQQERTRLGRTQAQLAVELERAGVPLAQQTIAKIESGTRPLKLAEAQAIATVLGVDVQSLVPGGDLGEKLYQLESLISAVYEARDRQLVANVAANDAIKALRSMVKTISVADYGDRPGEFATAHGIALNLIREADDSAP